MVVRLWVHLITCCHYRAKILSDSEYGTRVHRYAVFVTHARAHTHKPPQHTHTHTPDSFEKSPVGKLVKSVHPFLGFEVSCLVGNPYFLRRGMVFCS
jgi:hypothetical protein